MKTLTPDEIESLLQARPNDRHPLDILGYGYTSDGARRFRSEHPNFLPQIIAHVESVLQSQHIFPPHIDPANPGFWTFIVADDSLFRLSSIEEVGLCRFERLLSDPMPLRAAVLRYVGRVANPDYVTVPKT